MLSVALLGNTSNSVVIGNEAQCQKLLNNTEQPHTVQQCVQQDSATTLSWASWFSGSSRSTQFHFLDLFELLFGSSERHSRDYGSSKKVSL
ncbi:hypothetical protein CWI71_00270 [Pseudidiomarina insulisalsae]|uniref:Uncharacterized protein n=1 Tax=Pseudidiomarina insulisalsae TaxID=575789 RepID=A0A432YR81_9GAMM|nr:hypothetical protein CWI71_00270 [Pseudidiomarina insulisalsae]